MNSRFNDENYSSCANSSHIYRNNQTSISAMKIVKTRLHNRMEDDFLSTYLVAYIEKEIAQEFSTDSIIDEFDLMRNKTKAKFF
ncbi:hypothetical protein GOBAR_DD17327 [Gossypium barbadense]|nr:hypothetical protein GOBAR_DD17327 [Gossypium barbadense]